MIRKVSSQRQQVAEQIENKGRSLGRVLPKNAKVFNINQPSVVLDGGQSKSFTWRKKIFYSAKPTDYYSIGDTDFSYWVSAGNDYTSTLLVSQDGSIKEFNIPQYSNIAYDIEVYRKSPVTITIPIRCVRSLAVEIDDVVVFDSGDSTPNTSSSVTISIPGQKWTRITVYYYTGFARTDDNFLWFNSVLTDIIEQSRIPVPPAPISIGASSGEYDNSIQITWSVENQSLYEFFQVWYSTVSSGKYGIVNSAIPGTQLSYLHNGIAENTHYWYKVRGVTSDGDVTDFTSPIEGYTKLTGGSDRLTIEFGYNDVFTDDDECRGHYTLSEDIDLKVKSSLGLSDSITPYVKFVQISGYDCSGPSTYQHSACVNTGANFVSKIANSEFDYIISGTELDQTRGGRLDVYAYAGTTNCTIDRAYSINTDDTQTGNSRYSVGDIITGYDTMPYIYYDNSEMIYGKYLDINFDVLITGYVEEISHNAYQSRYEVYVGIFDTGNKTCLVEQYEPLRYWSINGNKIPELRSFKLHKSIEISGSSAVGFVVIPSITDTIGRLYTSGDCSAFWSNIRAVDYAIISADTPIFEFMIDGDGVFTGSEDAFTNTSGVYIVSKKSTSAVSDNSFYYIDGQKYYSPLYGIKFGNTIPQRNQATYMNYYANTPYTWNLSSTVAATGYNVFVYGRLSDKAGSYADASDSIFYATGATVVVPSVTSHYKSHYDRITFEWVKPNIQELAGFQIYKRLSSEGLVPDSTIPVYDTIPNSLITSYIDFWQNGSNILQNTEYSYWVKAYSQLGLVSSGFGVRVSGYLCDTLPYYDKCISVTKQSNGFIIKWQPSQNYSVGNIPSGRWGTEHYIYRISGSTSDFANSTGNAIQVGIIKDTYGGIPTTDYEFSFTDVPPSKTDYYKYFSLAKNDYGYMSTGNMADFPNGSFSSGDRLVGGVGDLNKPQWYSGYIYSMVKGIYLGWYPPSEEESVVGYMIYRAEGDAVGDPDPFPDPTLKSYYVSYTYEPNSDVVVFVDKREDIPDINSRYTYWIRAKNSEDSWSLFSDPVTTGLKIGSSTLLAPIFVSGECYNDYGFNHLTISGQPESEGILAGYKIYRDYSRPDAIDGGYDASVSSFPTGTTLIATIADDVAGGKVFTYNDVDIIGGRGYYYAARAFNIYGDLGPSGILPAPPAPLYGIWDYSRLFTNFLDNSSFERVPDINVNWDPGLYMTRTTTYGAHAGAMAAYGWLGYSGYIFVQPNTTYTFSLYARRANKASAASITGSIIWYTPSGRDAGSYVSKTSIYFNVTGVTSVFDRYIKASFTSPSTATSAALDIDATNNVLVDAVQFEEGASVTTYTDSRVMSADRMMAHFIKGDMVDFGTLRGKHIEAYSISGYNITAGTITADKLAFVPQNYTPITSGNFYDLTTGLRTIVVAGTDLWCKPGTVYTITSVGNGYGGSVYGKTFTADVGTYGNTFYAYYSFNYSGVLWFSNRLSDAVDPAKSDFIVSQFKLSANDGTEGGGYFKYLGAYAGPGVTIEGNQISAGYISSALFSGGSFTGAQIRGNTIEGYNIKAGTLTTDKLSVRSPNMVFDPYFNRVGTSQNVYVTSLCDWDLVGEKAIGTWITDTATAGALLFKPFTLCRNTTAYVQTNYLRTSKKIPVDPNKIYSFGALFRYNSSASTSHNPTLRIQQYSDMIDDGASIGDGYDQFFGSSVITVANDTWVFISGSIGPGLTRSWNSACKGIRINAYHEYTVAPTAATSKAWYGGTFMLEGDIITSGWYSDGASVTIIDGAYVKTGTVDADVVNIFSGRGDLLLSGGAIISKYRSSPSVSGSIIIAGGEITNVDGANYSFRYPKRYHETTPAVLDSSAYITTNTIYSSTTGKAFKSPPKISVVPVSDMVLYGPINTGYNQFKTVLVHASQNYGPSYGSSFNEDRCKVSYFMSERLPMTFENRISFVSDSMGAFRTSAYSFNVGTNYSLSTLASAGLVIVSNGTCTNSGVCFNIQPVFQFANWVSSEPAANTPCEVTLNVYLASGCVAGQSTYTNIRRFSSLGTSVNSFVRTYTFNSTNFSLLKSSRYVDNFNVVFETTVNGGVTGQCKDYCVVLEYVSTYFTGDARIASAKLGYFPKFASEPISVGFWDLSRAVFDTVRPWCKLQIEEW